MISLLSSSVKRTSLLIGCLFLSFLSIPVYAKCQSGDVWRNKAFKNSQGSLGISSLVMFSDYLQPVGTLLAANTVDAAGAFIDLNPSDVLYWCDSLGEANRMQVFFAVDADDWGSGGTDEPTMSYTYYTRFTKVGFKISLANTGQIATQFYQSYSVTPQYNPGKNRYEILASQLSPITIELYKMPRKIKKIGLVDKGSYKYKYPLVQYAFNIPGVASGVTAGASAASNWKKASKYALSYGISDPPAFLSANASCIVRVNTPIVNFSSISVQELNEGGYRQEAVSLTFECDSGIINIPSSDLNQGATAFGFRIPIASFAKSQQLSLVNSAGGLTFLISNNYDAANVARGVGVRLQNVANNKRLNFLGWAGSCAQSASKSCRDASVGGGNFAGWYNVLDGAVKVGQSGQDTVFYEQHFNAFFEKIPSERVTPGKYHSVAEVLVRVQ